MGEVALRFPVVSVEQPIGTFYVGSVRAAELLKIVAFDYRRMEYQSGYVDFLGIQRPLNPRRVKEISAYSRTVDACFPTSIVISIDERCAKLEASAVNGVDVLTISTHDDPEDSSLSIGMSEIASIIDGQHRLKGLEDANHLEFDVSVSIFVGADDATEATIFSIVNLAQTKVNKSLVYDLFSVSNSRSPERTCHELVVALDRIDVSPFKNRIKRLGTATDGRFGETLSQATVVQGILPYISNDPLADRDRGKRFGFWDEATQEDIRKRIFFPFFQKKEDVKILQILINYFTAVQEKWPDAWNNNGTGSVLARTNGFMGLIRFLRPAYLHATTTPRVVSKDEFAKIFAPVQLVSDDFNPRRFIPGSSGSSELYRTLLAETYVSK